MWFSRRSVPAAALTALLLLTSCAETDDGASESTDQADDSLSESEQSAAEQSEQEQREEEERLQQLVADHDAALAGPSEQHDDEAAELVAQMSVEEQAGQVLIGEYSGTDAESAAQLIEDLHLGGVILMGHNIPGGTSSADTEALAAQIETIAAAGIGAEAEERAAPPIISVDQEGGLVTRVGEPVTEWPAPMAYGAAAAADAQQGRDLARTGHRGMAEELAELGFTLSFAPSADVTVGADDPTIGSRSFGSDPQEVAQLAHAGVRGLAEGGLAGSIKHFPGHGSVTEDSHRTLPVQDASIEQLRERDWVPFAESIEAGAPMVMMGHVEVPALEAGVPSSLSEAAYQEIRQMGHDGVIVTDAMNMAAVAQRYGGDQAVVDALAAGADLLLMPASAPGAHAAIVEAVESDQLPQGRLGEAAERVVALALWQQDLAAGELTAGPGAEIPEDLAEELGRIEAAGTEASRLVSESAVTLVQGECEAQLVDEAIQIAGGTQQDRARLAAAAQRAGIQVGWGTTVTLLGGTTPGSGEVVVALDRPEALTASTAETKIALYGRTPESFDVLVDVLTGAEPEGALPVDVAGQSIGHSAC
ncbi:MAG: glycoside hydrolase family 3 N-terminal domain-containing protein [Nesterenkonia sp.]